MSNIAEVDFDSYPESVKQAFDEISAAGILAKQKTILIKPNLVNGSPFPITTKLECCAEIVEYIKSCSGAKIIIGEGCGDTDLETDEVFEILGYSEYAASSGIDLIDLNYAPLVELENPDCPVFPKMYLPKIVMEAFLISVPVLKAHSLSEMTGSLKNMIGVAPPKYYAGTYGVWKKAVFHNKVHQAILDLNSYRTPDLTLMDASVGMAEFHLGGAHCNPPIAKLLAGINPTAVDRRGAELLGMNWKEIEHLQGP